MINQMEDTVGVAIVDACIDTRGMFIGEELVLLAMQVNGVGARLHRLYTQDIIRTGRCMMVAKDAYTWTLEIRHNPITEQFSHLCVFRG